MTGDETPPSSSISSAVFFILLIPADTSPPRTNTQTASEFRPACDYFCEQVS
jgi:hypothetical protein